MNSAVLFAGCGETGGYLRTLGWEATQFVSLGLEIAEGTDHGVGLACKPDQRVGKKQRPQFQKGP